ncbi:MAG: hypothetical protein H0T60_10920 [Acidobacteria bacterium]|nr:hypothetical protein [Acidobacteriota bacterium]
MKLTCWGADTRVVSLGEVMSWCLLQHHVDRMLVALRLEQHGNKWRYANEAAGESVKALFAPFILTGFQASEWPGTQLVGHPGFVYVLNFDEAVKNIVLATQPSLDKWGHSEDLPLPEDICLFKEADSHPILVSRTHDLDAWLITDKEPTLQGFAKTNIPPGNMFPEGRFFCKKYERE